MTIARQLVLLFGLLIPLLAAPQQPAPPSASTPLVLVLIGPPGSGKTTQATFLTKRLNLPIIALEELQKPGTSVDESLRQRVQRADARLGFILDGYPSTRAQADHLTKLVKDLKLTPPLIIQLDVKDEVVRKRLAQSKRAEDQGASLDQRLATYHKELDLMRSYYPESDIWTINGDRPSREVSDTILSLLSDRK